MNMGSFLNPDKSRNIDAMKGSLRRPPDIKGKFVRKDCERRLTMDHKQENQSRKQSAQAPVL